MKSYLGGKTINEIVDETSWRLMEKIKKDESWDYEKTFLIFKRSEKELYTGLSILQKK